MAQESKPVQGDKNITKKKETKKHSHFDSMHSKAERWEVCHMLSEPGYLVKKVCESLHVLQELPGVDPCLTNDDEDGP